MGINYDLSFTSPNFHSLPEMRIKKKIHAQIMANQRLTPPPHTPTLQNPLRCPEVKVRTKGKVVTSSKKVTKVKTVYYTQAQTVTGPTSQCQLDPSM